MNSKQESKSEMIQKTVGADTFISGGVNSKIYWYSNNIVFEQFIRLVLLQQDSRVLPDQFPDLTGT